MTMNSDIETLQRELLEATELLRAIREGEVDAFVLQSRGKYRVEALVGADSPYRVLVESMRDCALTVSENGDILFCNRPFVDKIGARAQNVVGEPAVRWIDIEGGMDRFLEAAQRGEAVSDAILQSSAGSIPVSVTVCALPTDPASVVFCLLLTDLSDRRAAEQLRIQQALLARRRAELEAILGRLPFALLLAEKPNATSYANPTAEALLAQHSVLQKRAAEVAAHVLAGARVDAEDVHSMGANGRDAIFHVYAAPLLAAELPRRALVVIQDVTAERLAARERERQQQLRETFVGILGHDLRNPLMVISTTIQTLALTDSRDYIPRAIAVIRRATSNMTRLIDDMLDLTLGRIGGGIPLSYGPADIEQIARLAIEEIRALVPSARVELDVVGDPRGEWDAARLGQVMSNLISNAIEHGDDSHAVRVSIDASGSSQIAVDVENHGEIPEELLPVIFDPFRRGDRVARRRGGGVGLGLYIAERIVSAHTGTISVMSRAGTTRFRFELPRFQSTG